MCCKLAARSRGVGSCGDLGEGGGRGGLELFNAQVVHFFPLWSHYSVGNCLLKLLDLKMHFVTKRIIMSGQTVFSSSFRSARNRSRKMVQLTYNRKVTEK